MENTNGKTKRQTEWTNTQRVYVLQTNKLVWEQRMCSENITALTALYEEYRTTNKENGKTQNCRQQWRACANCNHGYA